MNALQTMKHELTKIQREQASYIEETGYLDTFNRERYNELGKEAKKYFDAINTLEELMKGVSHDRSR